MVEVIPFRGIHYDSSRVRGELAVAPPYDVLTDAAKAALYEKSHYNIARIDAGLEMPGDDETENKYSRAAALMRQWLGEGVLTQSPEKCYYACRIDFELSGERVTLSGIFALVSLVELGKGVYPHEATHSKPKTDRLNLMQHTGANTSPVYSIYTPPGEGIGAMVRKYTEAEPYMAAADHNGAEHRFHIISGRDDVSAIEERLRGSNVFIADGHHRYETALEYARMEREKANPGSAKLPSDYVLMFLVDASEPGLRVLPTHRMVTVDAESLVEKLSTHFRVQELAKDGDILKSIAGRKRTFGMYADGKKYMLTCGQCKLEDVEDVLAGLDVVLLHKLVFGRLLDVGNWAYEMHYDTVVSNVDGGEYDAAFFLNPTGVGDVQRVAKALLRMPPKSTYFYPKVQTGFVMNTLKSL